MKKDTKCRYNLIVLLLITKDVKRRIIKLGSYFIQIPIFKYFLTRDQGVRTLAGSLISGCDGPTTKGWNHPCITEPTRVRVETSSATQMGWNTQAFSSANTQ